jgi:8-oxo-dGTP diphosphatase
MSKQYCYDYPRPSVTVDVVVVTRERSPRVLLIRRKHAPFEGRWALPGGFIDMDETLEASARRELLEETGLRPRKLAQLATFGDPGRDPRGRTVSVVYLAEVGRAAAASAGDDAAEAAWFPLRRLPPLAFDHRDILRLARRHLRGRM